MARLARVVVPGLPHHVTQRGNGRARTFFGDDDYALYRDLLATHCRAADVGFTMDEAHLAAALRYVRAAESIGRADRQRPLPHPHRENDRARAQAGQTWAEAGRGGLSGGR
ncbi:hypothetical protein [Bradyrhizobium oligotrophicum]|uniref:hypothetical protein n=1 Tax=Bradyrhizobium oligotrophicum TaxID=44255 RepID=UPI003EC02DA1